jgi:hypothetical protein
VKLNFKYLEQDTNFAKNFKVRVQVRYVTEDTEQASGHVVVPCTKDKKTYFFISYSATRHVSSVMHSTDISPSRCT